MMPLILLASMIGAGVFAYKLFAARAHRLVKLASSVGIAIVGLVLLRIARGQVSPEAFQAGELNSTGFAGITLMIFGLICGFVLAILHITRQMREISAKSRR